MERIQRKIDRRHRQQQWQTMQLKTEMNTSGLHHHEEEDSDLSQLLEEAMTRTDRIMAQLKKNKGIQWLNTHDRSLRIINAQLFKIGEQRNLILNALLMWREQMRLTAPSFLYTYHAPIRGTLTDSADTIVLQMGDRSISLLDYDDGLGTNKSYQVTALRAAGSSLATTDRYYTSLRTHSQIISRLETILHQLYPTLFETDTTTIAEDVLVFDARLSHIQNTYRGIERSLIEARDESARLIEDNEQWLEQMIDGLAHELSIPTTTDDGSGQ